jgi:peptidoglycan/LPS O-acetylase OafA/YrhL
VSSVTDDRFLWSRVSLAVLSVGFVVVTARLVLIDMLAFEPEDHLPTAVIATPAVIALVGIALAGFGGQPARIAAVLYGLVVSGGVAVTFLRHPGMSGSSPLVGVLLMVAGVAGIAAMVVALQEAPRAPEASGTAAH